ncbi:MAG TPA: GNAT family N-acetyltransferase [Roseiflexaceae bacterium]|nr:GNAT family N-acetyltransferase [Roseiflexaceae bacterium]
MSEPGEIVVRALAGEAETDALFRTLVEMFSSNPQEDAQVGAWRAYVTGLPGGYPGMLRGAFRGGAYLGGYIHYELELHIGAARIRTGCIGGVATRTAHRRQGAASALMRDAVEHGRARRQGLLLLDGIGGFYHRFGFVDVLDITRHLVSRAAVLDLPPGDHRVRQATEADAPALLELYERHYGGYPGSFTRTLERQRYFVRTRLPKNPPLLAVDPAGRVRGYLLLPWYAQHHYAQEAAADTWPAALALLRHHAELLETDDEPPEELIWPLPPDSPTFYQLADHLYLTSRTNHHPNEGWMARPAHLPGLLASLVPELHAQWRRAGLGWRGTLGLAVDAERFALALAPGELRLAEQASDTTASAALTLQVFTQLVFGFRPVWWAAGQEGQRIPAEAAPLLAALFPPRTAWVAGSDAF